MRMKRSDLVFTFLLVAGCGDVDTTKLGNAQMDIAYKNVSLCTDITDETKALSIAHYAETLIDRKHKLPCTHETDLWIPDRHKAMKDAGFHFVKFKIRNYKPNSNQQRMEIRFSYEDSAGLKKDLSYSCEMTDKMKELTLKAASPEC